jgi:hypothetical protein
LAGTSKPAFPRNPENPSAIFAGNIGNDEKIALFLPAK